MVSYGHKIYEDDHLVSYIISGVYTWTNIIFSVDSDGKIKIDLNKRESICCLLTLCTMY